MLLNAHEIGGAELNAPDPEQAEVLALPEINGHELAGAALNGNPSDIQPGGAGTFEFNGEVINFAEINGGPIENLGSTDITTEQVDIGEWGFETAGEGQVIAGVTAAQPAPGEWGFEDPFTDDAAFAAFTLEVTVEIQVVPITGTAVFFVEQVVYGLGTAEATVEIEVTDSDVGEIEAPVEVVVYGADTVEVVVEQRVFDVSAFSPVGGDTLRWRGAVTLKGDDVSSALTGPISVEASENSARVANFTIKPSLGVVELTDWVGAEVEIDFIAVDSTGAVVSETRVFTGVVDVPIFDPIEQLTTFECTDNLQKRAEKTTTDFLAGLIGGRYSDLIFEPDEEPDNWQYVLDRISTTPKSISLDPLSRWRVATEWEGKVTPDYLFDSGSILDESLELSLTPLRDIISKVTIDFGYRFQRLRERRIRGSWNYPSGFCHYLESGETLPYRNMIESAAGGTGWDLLAINYVPLPPSQVIFCQPNGNRAWVNTENSVGQELCLGAWFTLAKRFAQSVREDYQIEIVAPASDFQEEVDELSYDITADYDTSDWENNSVRPTSTGASLIPQPTGPDDRYFDKDDQVGFTRADMNDAILTAIDIGKTRILEAHRQNLVTFSVSMRPYLDLIHTLEVDTTPIQARGKVSRIIHEMDVESGTATTTAQLSISKVNGTPTAEDPTTVPPEPDTVSPMTGDVRISQLGSRWGAQEFSQAQDLVAEEDDPFEGWTSNIIPAYPGAPRYQEAFIIETVDIPEEDRDEIEATQPATYNVDIPDELLVMTA